MTSANQYFEQGELDNAIKAVGEDLSQHPDHTAKRAFLAEMLCIKGEYERADRQLDTLVSLEPESALSIGTWRQLIRAAKARDDVFHQGAAPEVVDNPTEHIQQLLGAHLSLRDGSLSEPMQQAIDLDASRKASVAKVNGSSVDDLRDLDDLCAGVLEVMTTSGQYFWVDFSQLSLLEFHPAERPLDLIWRKATIVLNNGTEGEVFVPAIYATPSNDSSALLGKKTDWLETNGLVRGMGQRCWLTGDEAMPFMDIERVEFSAAAD